MPKTISWTHSAWAEYQYWQKEDKQITKKINTLIKEISRTSFEGIGKPEALKHQLANKWSRRINHEHRLVYEVKEETILIFQCRYHY